MRYSYYTLLLLSGVLAGCNSGESSTNVEYSLNQKFAQHPVGEFSHDYGFPGARYAAKDSGSVYVWASTRLHVSPAEVRLSNYSGGNEIVQVADDYKGTTDRQYCELHIYASRDDVIQKIAVSVDSIGKFSQSRCSEIF